MAEIKKTALFDKLNDLSYKALVGAVEACMRRENPYVEIAHWVDRLLDAPNLDVTEIVRAFGLDRDRVLSDTTAALDRLPRGASSINSFSTHITDALEQGFLWSSVHFNAPKIRSGHLLLGVLKNKGLREILTHISPQFEKIRPDELADSFATLLSASAEEVSPSHASDKGSGSSTSKDLGPTEKGKQEALRKFTVDLTEKARRGEVDPIVGRDSEIDQCIRILMRRTTNNLILTGEAGVGKTAVVEGLAQRILSGDIPPSLADVSIHTLDIGLLQAGASMRGEFEQRLKNVIDEVQASPKPIILFIDEAHTLMGAGGNAGTNDAANLLKPALARGTLRTIAATTWDEYKRHIEKDSALVRRFQVVKVEEPSEESCIRMMRSISSRLEKHHRVQLLDEASEAAVRLSHRYIASRQLPDKAVSLMDIACARVAVSQHAVPPEVYSVRRRIQALETEQGILNRESAIGLDHQVRLSDVTKKLDLEKATLLGLEQRWTEEKDLVKKVLELRAKLRGAGIWPDEALAQTADKVGDAFPQESPAIKEGTTKTKESELSPGEREKMLGALRSLQERLTLLQGENPLIFPTVDAGAIATVVAEWTGVPVGRMMKDEISQVLVLADEMERRVIGQRHALDLIANRVQSSRAQLNNPLRPVGVFMLAGPSGTGKTETALTLADALFGGIDNMIALNMTEYTQEFTVSKIMGPPPGYVGHEQGGILTNFVQKRPYCLVLLDEFEKAHPEALRLFMQVFEYGHLMDGKGRDTDFRNTIIIVTTNAAQEAIVDLCQDATNLPSASGLEKALRAPLKATFPDALLNRILVVPYYPISKEVLNRIIDLQLAKIDQRVREHHRVPLTYDETVPALIAKRCSELERGARMIEALITNTLLPKIGREVLNRLAVGTSIKQVHLSTQDGEFTYAFD